MRARILALSLALAGHASAQVTQVRPTVVNSEPVAMYYACWTLSGVRQSCAIAGPQQQDYERLRLFLLKSGVADSVFQVKK